MLQAAQAGSGGCVTKVPDETFELGPWRVRPQLGELSHTDTSIHLEPKVMGVLVSLARNAGEVITRDQFIEQVWGGRIVSDEVLSRCISLLRNQLGDDPKNPEYIQTVPKIGYRLIKPVQWQDKQAAQSLSAAEILPRSVGDARSSQRTSGRPANRWFAIAAIGAAVVVLATWYVWRDGSPPVEISGTPVIAVLPFTYLGGDSSNEFFSDGLTEDLIDRLANLPGIDVVASTSVFALKGGPVDIREIAEKLGVSHILTGSVRKEGDRIRITAALTEARNGLVRWSKKYETAYADIFAVQDEISVGIVNELTPRLRNDPSSSVEPDAPTNVMPAYELALRGRFHLRKREEAPILQSIDLFRKAIELDPHFGEAYIDLARAYALLPTYSYEDPDEMFQLAEDTLERGATMDPSIREKIFDVRAFLHFSRWEWIDAELDFRRALELTPNDPNLHQWYSQQLAAVGKPDLALQSVLQAKRLDTLSPAINQRLAVVYQWVDDDQHAYQQFQLARELGMGPRANPEAYALQLVRRKEYSEARAILLDLQRVFQRASDWVDPVIVALQDPSRQDAALDALESVAADRQISLKYLQGAYVVLGAGEPALNVAFELLHQPLDFEVEFLFARENEVVRRQPRFGELLREIGLDQYWDEFGWPEFCARDGGDIVCQ
jgi:TolB-like protein/DNA-binding winged helix-turn-helix (wHTH) protein/Tfp pilus assembly protein PilF